MMQRTKQAWNNPGAHGTAVPATTDSRSRHSMARRSAAHDYSRTGIYHITMHVAEGMGQPLGQIVGDETAPQGSPDAPHTQLSAVGKMVEQELLHSIHSRYAMVSVQDYVVMPDHLHFLLVVQDTILSIHGKKLPLGQVIAGFKKGCNKRFWAMTGQADTTNGGQSAAHSVATAAAPATTNGGQSAAHSVAAAAAPATTNGGQTAAHSVPAGLPGAPPLPTYKTPSTGTTGRHPLFAPGFCDVMPVDAAQLATQRQYIKDNPRSRLLRSKNRSSLSVHRGAIGTAITLSALRGYLQRECHPSQATAAALAAIEGRLLVADSGQTAAHSATAAAATNGGQTAARTVKGGQTAARTVKGGAAVITCDSYGDRGLLQRLLLPVVCHRKDAARYGEQKARCLEEAARGAVLVSARIAKGEQAILDEAAAHGHPVVVIADNGFPPLYHPSTDRIDACADGRLLLVTPWQYLYRGKNEQVTVPFCKTMNCVAQALCRTKDSWWKEPIK